MRSPIAWVPSILTVAVIVALVGYYQPRVNDYQRRVGDLLGEVSVLEQDNAGLTATVQAMDHSIGLLEAEKDSLSNSLGAAEDEIEQFEVQIATLTSDVATLNSNVTALKSQVTSLSTQVAGLNVAKQDMEKRYDSVMGITVTQRYDWQNTWSWELPIPLSLYVEYRERPRPRSVSGFVELARDPGDDVYIDQMVEYINAKSLQYGFTPSQTADFVITFVQSLPYTTDSVTKAADEYPRYPVETLFDRGGDCEDTSILVAAILDRMGYDVALVHLPGHMAVGIVLPGATGRFYEYQGKRYFYLETTGEGWKVGVMPNEYIGKSAYLYPLRG